MTTIPIDTFREPTFFIEQMFNANWHGEEGKMIRTTWKFVLTSSNDMPGYKSDHLYLQLITIENKSFVVARIRLCILINQDESNIVILKIKLKKFECNDEIALHLNNKKMNRLARPYLISRQTECDEVAISLEMDIQADAITENEIEEIGQMTSDEFGSRLVDGHLSDVVFCVEDRRFPGSSCDPGGKVTRFSSDVHVQHERISGGRNPDPRKSNRM